MRKTSLASDLLLFDERVIDDIPHHELHLCLEFGQDEILITLLNKRNLEYLAFEEIKLYDLSDFQTNTEEIESALDNSKLLKLKKSTSSCTIHNNLSTIVPNVLFNEDKTERYLNLSFEMVDNCKYLNNSFQNLDARNVFAIPKNIWRLLKKSVKGAEFYHFSTFLIDYLLLKYKNDSNTRAVLVTNDDNFQLLILKGHELIFYNHFNYHHEDDLVYFVMFTLEQLKIDKSKLRMTSTGVLSPQSSHLQKLAKYAGEITEEKPDVNLNSNINWPKEVLNFNFSLFNHHLCV